VVASSFIIAVLGNLDRQEKAVAAHEFQAGEALSSRWAPDGSLSSTHHLTPGEVCSESLKDGWLKQRGTFPARISASVLAEIPV